MTKSIQDLRVIFMGTPEFAVASLQALLETGVQIAAVVTAPDKASGRGMHINQSAVKKYSEEKGLPVLQPVKLKDPEFQKSLQKLNVDLQVVVAFRMLPEAVWNMPALGTINLHGSLLPQYRGAAPINWAVINGEKITGVTTFQLEHAIDTGSILLQESFPIEKDDDAGSVHDKMKVIGANLLVKTLKGFAEGSLKPRPQEQIDPQNLKTAPKIFTETCQINFTRKVEEVHNLIRGLSPFPVAYCHLQGQLLKVYRSEIERVENNESDQGVIGDMISDGKTFLKFRCKDGFIHLKDVQLQGKKRMLIEDFLRGFRLLKE